MVLCCSVLIVADGVPASPRAAPAASPDPTAASHPAHPPGRGRPTATHPAATVATAASAEQIDVVAGVRTANGVTNTTPGGGLMAAQTAPRSQSGITRDYIAKQSPATSPSVLLSGLPGVVGGATDPFGASQQDEVTVRGLTQSELGFELEGIPIQDPVNGNVFTADMVDTDNIASVTLTQGSSDIAAPFYSAAGGQVKVDTVNPSHHAGGLLDLSYGTADLQREFVRLETGDIGQSGVRAFASYSNTQYDAIRGPGHTDRHHVDFKALKEWGDGDQVAVNFGWDAQRNNSLDYPTLAQFNALGTSFNYNADYTPGDTSYYKLQYQYREDLIGSVPVHLHLDPQLTLDVTPYYVSDTGIYGYPELLQQNGSDFGTVPIASLDQPFATGGTLTEQTVDREDEASTGVTSRLAWTRGGNTLSTGYWYAYLQHTELESFTTVDLDGNVPNDRGDDPIKINGQVLTGYNINFKQQTNAVFVEDRYAMLDDRLVFDAGFREVMLQRVATNLIPGENYANGGNVAEPLPRASVSYRLTPHDQVYADVTTAFSAPSSEEIYVDLFDPTGGGKPVESRNTDPKSEYAIGEELGYRHDGPVNVSLALFNYNLVDHQITSSNYIGGVLISQPINVGGETIRGGQLELGVRPWHHLSPYLSLQYLHTSIGNDIEDGGDYLPTKGKSEVLSPTLSGSVGISYDDGRLFGNLFANWASRQYSTFINDESLPAYAVANMTLGYRFRTLGFAQHPQIQLNLTNFTDNDFLSGVYGYTGAAHATRGVFGTTIAGSAPTYFVGAGPQVILTLTTGF